MEKYRIPLVGQIEILGKTITSSCYYFLSVYLIPTFKPYPLGCVPGMEIPEPKNAYNEHVQCQKHPFKLNFVLFSVNERPSPTQLPLGGL